MPFPLAHPAAVLPFRRFCPRWLDLPALVIGSLTPDLSYSLGIVKLDQYAHQLLGTIAFSLPIGLLILGAFYFMRAPLLRLLPVRYAQIAAQAPVHRAAPLPGIVVSIILGAWSHVLLDSISHRDGWFVQHISFMEQSLGTFLHHQVTLYQVAWFGFTFAGVTWSALTYLKWLQVAAKPRNRLGPGMRWGYALGGAVLTIVLALAHRLMQQSYQMYPIAAGMLVIALGFALQTARMAVSDQEIPS